MIVVLTGAPGAGKGTQADRLAGEFQFRKISTGDALRKHVANNTEIGVKAKSYMDSGNLVPDDILLEIIKEEIGKNSEEKIILDGYPRNLEQLKALQSLDLVHEIAGVVHLKVSDQKLIERLSGRRVCPKCSTTYHLKFKPPVKKGECDKCGHDQLTQRSDDFEDKIRNRLKVYAEQTAPVIDYYENSDQYREVDGSVEMAVVTKSLSKAIAALRGLEAS